MEKPRWWKLLLIAVLLLLPAGAAAQSFDASPPERPVKLIFIHHSTGYNWLADEHGGLGRALAANNYFVSDTHYGWGPDSIGDRTDIINWPEWFTGPESGRYLTALYAESGQIAPYVRPLPDPGGENQIVLFKSCFPNSNLEGSPDDPPERAGDRLSVGNAKAIYNELLAYFASRPDKLFVVITAPPLQDPTWAANARAFNNWLVNDWLENYEGVNVAVFDYYNVLTHPDSHHRFMGSYTEHSWGPSDTLHYPTDPGDDHPAPEGNDKATEEFLPLLNVWYNLWQPAAGAEIFVPAISSAGDEPYPVPLEDAAPEPYPIAEQPEPTPEQGDGGGGICPGSAAVGLMALLGVAWVRRR